jgi:hypothetical protein
MHTDSFDPKEARLEAIARDELGFETLVTRSRDSLDFKEVSVWGVRNALREACAAGVTEGKRLAAGG